MAPKILSPCDKQWLLTQVISVSGEVVKTGGMSNRSIARPPPSLPTPCFSTHSWASPSPRLLPAASSRHSGILRLLQPDGLQETQRGREDREGRKKERKERPTGVNGRVSEGKPNRRREEAVSGLPLCGVSESRVLHSASSRSVLSWKPNLPAKHLGATFLGGRKSGVCLC